MHCSAAGLPSTFLLCGPQGGARPPIPTPTPSAPPEPSPCLAPAQDRAAGACCGTVSARDPVSARGWRPVLRVGHRAFILPQVLCSLNHGFNYLIFSSSEKEFSFPYSNQYSASLLCLVCRVTEVKAVGVPTRTDSSLVLLSHPPAGPVARLPGATWVEPHLVPATAPSGHRICCSPALSSSGFVSIKAAVPHICC